MNPVLLGGDAFAPTDFIHSRPLASAHTGVPSGAIRQVNPLVPVCKGLALPSLCGITIVAAFTMESGAAVLTFARYAGSDFGISEVRSCADAAVTRAAVTRVNANPARVGWHIMDHLLQGSTGPRG